MAINAREAALLSLVSCEKQKKFANLEIDAGLNRFELSEKDRALYTMLVYGVIEREITLDYLIKRLSARSDDKRSIELTNILRLGLYQLLYLDRIPVSAACNESVELAKKYARHSEGYVNAVLRNCARLKDRDALPFPEMDSIEYISVFYGYPEWLCEFWMGIYGKARTESIFSAMNQRTPLTLRVNTLKITRDEFMQRLSNEHPEYKLLPTELSDSGIRVFGSAAVSELSELNEGLCFVQDEASQLCASALGAETGMKVIDCCACPGGKTFSIAMGMQNLGEIRAFDLHESKLSLINSGAERLGIDIISTSVHNGTVFDPALEASADRILCDVPCSGLGVIAKKPDLRKKNPEDIARLPDIQFKILENGLRYLKPGGKLVYSTCTLNPRENDEVIARAQEERLATVISQQTMLPDIDGTDGFFISVLTK